MSWDLDVAPRQAVEPRKAPAKRWRNWWEADVDGHFEDGTAVPKGTLLESPQVYPSKEIAQQKARDVDALDRAKGFAVGIYLGALPEGETPKRFRP